MPPSIPLEPVKGKRYTLAQLLEGATPKAIKALNDETAWSREGEAVGHELHGGTGLQSATGAGGVGALHRDARRNNRR